MAKKTKDLQYYEAVGRRREATARVRLYIVSKGKNIEFRDNQVSAGQVYINGKSYENIYALAHEKKKLLLPLELTTTLDRFAVTIVTEGGGKSGQLTAIVHGLSRALCDINKEEYRPTLKQAGLLTRDPRIRERRKVGTGGKARRAKQSPKR